MLFLIFAGLGLYALGDALDWWVPFVVVAAVALLSWPQAVVTIARFLVAAVVAIVVVAGFDVLAGWLDIHPAIWVGLVVALVVFGLAAYPCLLALDWEPRPTALAAGLLSAFVILAVPVLWALHKSSDSESVPSRERVASSLDVLIVSDGRHHPPPAEVPPDPSLAGFDVSYSVGYDRAGSLHWTLTGAPSAGEALSAVARGDELPPLDSPPALRQGADSVLLLLVDGTAPVTEKPQDLPNAPGSADEVARWQSVASSFSGTPAFALLQTTDPRRLERWQDFAAPGGAVSAQALQSLTVTDAAARLAISAPTSQADFALAQAHRPLLLFDEEESVPRPLNVATLFEEGRVRLCQNLGVTGANCSTDPVRSPADLENGGTHLRLERPTSAELRKIAFREREEMGGVPAPAIEEGAAGSAPAKAPPPGTGLPGDSSRTPGAGSAIYVHPVSVEREGRRLLYLDYWWYLPDNPSDVGGGALCGAGLVIAGATCNNHQSDWEGLTVVVDRTGAKPFVTAVQYAQHNSVVRYGWQLLRKRWLGDPQMAALAESAPTRPLAFVAKGSHATYPTRCNGSCHEVAAGLGEGRHRGNLPWIGNETGACGGSGCLLPLPTRDGGRQPALWNAFTGAWGDVDCFLAYYCDSGVPPKAPGQQGRYRHPTQYSGIVGKDWQFHREAFEE